MDPTYLLQGHALVIAFETSCGPGKCRSAGFSVRYLQKASTFCLAYLETVLSLATKVSRSIELAPELVQEGPQVGDVFSNDPSPFL